MQNLQDHNKVKCIGIVSPWPKVKNAEFEVIERMKIAIHQIGLDYIIVDSQGEYVEGSHKQLDSHVDFLISMHFIAPKFWQNFTYYAIWNPVRFYHDAGYSDMMKHVASYDDFLVYGSQPMYQHIKNYLKNSPFEFDNTETTWVAGCAGAHYKPTLDMFNQLKLFYVGINWERIAKKRGRHHNLLKLFDAANSIKIYGPKKFEGVRPWKGFKNYIGDIPFDGVSIIKELNSCGISLVLSSDQHKVANSCSSRIYESCHAGCLIISDKNKIVEKEFGDSVLYFQYGKSDEETFQNIMKLYNWACSNKEAALQMAKTSQDIYLRKHEMSVSLQRIITNHPKRLKKHIDRLGPNNRQTISVIIPWTAPNLDGFEELLVQVKSQSYIHINILVVSDPCTKTELSKIFQEKYPNLKYKLIEFSIFEASLIKTFTPKGNLTTRAIESCTSDFFTILEPGQYWYKDHIASLIEALSNKPECNAAIAGIYRLNQNGKKSLDYIYPNNNDIANIVSFKLFSNQFAAIYRNHENLSKTAPIFELIDSELNTGYMVYSLLTGQLTGNHMLTAYYDHGALLDNQAMETRRVATNLYLDSFNNLANYRKLIVEYGTVNDTVVDFHSIRRAVLGFYSYKLHGHPKLFKLVKWVYRKFIMRLIY